MKKFTSVLAVCSMLCVFTACGHRPENDTEMKTPPEYQQKISVSDIDMEYFTEHNQEAITVTTTTRTAYTIELPQETTAPYVPIQYTTEYQPETTVTYTETQYTTKFQPITTETVTSAPERTENINISADIYSAIENYLECINNNDIYGVIKTSYPDRYADTIRDMNDIEGISLDDIIGDMYREKNMHLSGANSYETLSEDYITRFSRLLKGFEPWRNYVEQKGTDKINYTDFIRIFKKIYNSENKVYFNITKAVKVNCNISSDNKGTKERDIVLYYVDGEGWKIDTVFMPCIQSVDKMKNNKFINSLNTFVDDINDFVEDNITDKITDYGEYYRDYYNDYLDDYLDYYDDLDYYADILEDEVNDFLDDLLRY